MKRSLISFFAVFALAFSTPAAADVDIGVSLMQTTVSHDGSEREKTTAGDLETTTKSVEEKFYGGSIYLELVADSGFTIGLDYVPVEIEIGDGSRTDSAVTDAKGGAENDTGTRTASAEIEDLITLYLNIPIMGSNFYGALGYHTADVTTSETLPTSTYPNANIHGYMVGLGYRAGKFKAEVGYSDFQEIKLDSSANDGTHIKADGDATYAKLSYGF